MKYGFILIPGGGFSDWLWQPLIPLLAGPARSVSRRIEPNTHENRLNASFSDIVDCAGRAIEASGFDEVVLVGHSGAGLVAGALGKANPRVRHVVFIAANIPRNRTTAIDAFPETVRWQNIEAVKAQAQFDSIPMMALEQHIRQAFCNTCTPEQTQYVLDQQFQPEPVCVLTQPMDWSDYPPIGLTYILCTQDGTASEEHQRMLASNLSISDIRPISSDHMVMISHPGELAAELNEIYSRYA